MIEKIFIKMKKMKMKEKDVWTFHQYNDFAINELNPEEKRKFIEFMEELCNKGYFEKEIYGSEIRYRLTQLGEKETYK